MKRRILRLALAALVVSLVGVLLFWLTLPSTRGLRDAIPAQTAYSLRRATQDPAHAQQFGAPVRFDALSPWLICAVVKAEDRFFAEHHGVDWPQTERAFRAWRRGNARGLGGSTITQQLVRNLYLSQERSIWRKVREIALARLLERHLDKRRILEIYLNVVEWGEGIWGIDAASRHYFDKSAEELDVLESIVLAAMLPNPRGAPSGSNLERMVRTHRRIVGQFHSARLVNDSDYGKLQRAMSELDRLLREGASWTDALKQVRSPSEPFLPPAPPRDPACGFEAERATDEKALARRNRKP